MSEKQYTGILVEIHTYAGGSSFTLDKGVVKERFVMSNRISDYREIFAMLLQARPSNGLVNVWYEERDGTNFVNGAKW